MQIIFIVVVTQRFVAFLPNLVFPFFPLHLRTESVAEKMLTNWFTFLLYKFLKVRPITRLDRVITLFSQFSVSIKC